MVPLGPFLKRDSIEGKNFLSFIIIFCQLKNQIVHPEYHAHKECEAIMEAWRGILTATPMGAGPRGVGRWMSIAGSQIPVS
jgi:hypothetical protein